MRGNSRRPAALIALAVVLIAGACGADKSASPSRPSASAGSSRGPSSSAVAPSGVAVPTASASAVANGLTVAGFWALSARALSRSGRMRLVLAGNGTRELRFEPKASGVIAGGTLASVCITGAAYTVQGLRSLTVPGKWACGGSALVSSFRRSGQPVYAWNTRLPADTKIKERVNVLSKDRWQWDYGATSKILGGSVHTTLVLDSSNGRLVSGSRTDRTGTTRYTFSYTTIFAPIALP